MPTKILGIVLIAVCLVALGPTSCARQETQSKAPRGTSPTKEIEMTAPTPSDPTVAPPDVAAPPADAEKSASGLASKVIQAGTGDRHPKATDTVTVHYTGWTTDGKMFDSSVTGGQPISFALNGVIKGWTEGLQLMVVGEKRRFWIPANLAYGENPRPGAPAGTLVFDVELLEIT
ncbi:MAG: FKBP-type peptidyl-prolyl cis-trans isomerase [Planctomycetota bacterium]|nr:FKBP-type peptidyl-prolyl cis-trans isomerase [Planctomycetota bacterium]